MVEPIKFWDGNEWQQHVTRLLKKRYCEPGAYQEMPSRDKGDLGLEGFSRDGVCYQCCASEEPLTLDKLYEKLRDKITSDIKKFVGNQKRLAGVFGPLKIKRWLLVVPRFQSTRLLEHAETKAGEVRERHLPYVADDFAVGVITDGEFETELHLLSAVGIYQHDIIVDEPAVAEVEGFAVTHSSLLNNVLTKAEKLPKLHSLKERTQFADHMVGHYLRGKSALDALRARDPEQFERFLRCKKTKERTLVVESMVQVGDAKTLASTFATFKNELQAQVSVSPNTADLLGWESVADWLLRCPLDF
jgi:hypothetical protein